MDFVLDCSITMAWFFQDEETSYTTAVRRSLGENAHAFVPSIWMFEVGNVFIISERRKRINEDKTALLLAQLKILPIHIEETPTFIITRNIMDIARKYQLSTYDAAYLELAIRKEIPISSLDKDLKKAAKKSGITIFHPEEDAFSG